MALDRLNFRDLGGLPAAQGAIRQGLLFRSEGPADLDPDQQSAMAALGIRNIFDLRSAREQTAAPHHWHGPHCLWHSLNVDADLRVFGNEGRERLLTGTDPQIAIDTMIATYRELPAALLPHWEIIGTCLQGDGVPVLINCTAGKDRTGVAVALVLEMAGVPREAIIGDYLRSEVFGQNFRASGRLEAGLMATFGFLPSAGQVEALIGVRREYLLAAWSAIDEQWGSVPHYLAEAGIPLPAQAAISRTLVDEALIPISTGEFA